MATAPAWCEESNPRTEIHVGLGRDTLNYSLTTGQAPTATQVDTLQELANKATAVE